VHVDNGVLVDHERSPSFGGSYPSNSTTGRRRVG